SKCAATLVRRFMSQLDVGDDHCAGAIPPLPLVPRFARRLHELDPAESLPGHEAGEEALRLVSAAILTCADVITRAAQTRAWGRPSGRAIHGREAPRGL